MNWSKQRITKTPFQTPYERCMGVSCSSNTAIARISFRSHSSPNPFGWFLTLNTYNSKRFAIKFSKLSSTNSGMPMEYVPCMLSKPTLQHPITHQPHPSPKANPMNFSGFPHDFGTPAARLQRAAQRLPLHPPPHQAFGANLGDGPPGWWGASNSLINQGIIMCNFCYIHIDT